MKRTLVCFLLVFVVVGALYAQEATYVSGGTAREMALGGNPNNPYLMDYTDVLTNPAWASKYADMIYSELGYNFGAFSASQQTAGFTYAVSKGFAIGLAVGYQEGPMFSQNSFGGEFAGTTTGTVQHTIDVTNSDYLLGGVLGAMNLYGAGGLTLSSATWRPLQLYTAFKLGGLSVGAGIYRVGWSGKQDRNTGNPATNEVDEVSFTQTGFKLGTLIDMDASLLDVSALFRLNTGDGKATPPGVTSTELSVTGTEFDVNARWFIKFTDKFSLIPMVRFYTFGYEPELSEPLPANTALDAKPDKYGHTEFEGGVGTNIALNGGKIFGGLSFESISLDHEHTVFTSGAGVTAAAGTPTATTKYTATVTALPKLNLGAEFEIASWLTGRLGYFKSFASIDWTYEPPSPARQEENSQTFDFQFMPPYNTSAAQQLLSVGLGLHFGRLSFDGYLTEEWLADGPYVVSGAPNPMFGVLSVSYNFQ